MKTLFWLMTLLLSCLFAQGQPITQTIKGNISDRDTQLPLVGATVMLIHTEPVLGAVTDENGFFRLEGVPIGRHSLRVRYYGYEDVVLNELMLGSGKELVLEIRMKEALESMETVQIESERVKDRPINDLATVSARTFSVEETRRYAASGNDPARMVQSYAGVAGGGDWSNEIVIRGNSPRGLLWRLEGVEIPNPNHFSGGEGSSGGAISILSTTVLSNSDFFTGAFPAEYGNALSGVFDLNLRAGNRDKHEFTLQAGAVGIQAAAEGPITRHKRASYLFNYRYSTVTILQKIGFDLGDDIFVPTYQDLSWTIHIPAGKGGRINLFGLAGMSSEGSSAERDTALWEFPSDQSDFYNRSRMGAGGISHTAVLPGNRSFLKSTMVFSGTDNRMQADSLNRTFEPTPSWKQQFSYYSMRLSTVLNTKFSPRHLLRSGAVYSLLGYHFYEGRIRFPQGDGLDELEDESGYTHLVQAFSQYQFRLNNRIDLNAGLHGMLFLLNGNFSIEPRLGFKWRLSPSHSIGGGLGLHSRLEPVSVYLWKQIKPDGTVDQPNHELGLTRAFHAVISYDWGFYPDFRLKTEIYYQYLFHVPVSADPERIESLLNFAGGRITEPFISVGSGRNIGLELTLEKFFSKDYYFLVTASLFDSRYQALDGLTRNTRFNANYIFNVLGGKEFRVGKQRTNEIGLNTRLIWKGGDRYRPIDLEASKTAGQTLYAEGVEWESPYPDFIRLDVSGNYRRNKDKYAWILTFDIQNLINRRNIVEYLYDPERQMIREIRSFGLIPSINFSIEF